MKRINILIVFCFFLSSITFAQNKQSYTGRMIVPKDFPDVLLHKYEGYTPGKSEADVYYEYYINQSGERIRDGKFNLCFTHLTKPLYIFGNYKNGIKTGVWTFITLPKGKDIVNNNSRTIQSNEADVYAKLSYDGGNLNGPFEALIGDDEEGFLVKGQIKNQCLTGQLSAVGCGEGGAPRGLNFDHIVKFTIPTHGKIEAFSLSGSFKEGFPDGEFKIIQTSGISKSQTRIFQDGKLIKLIEVDESTGESQTITSPKVYALDTADIVDSLFFESETYYKAQNGELYVKNPSDTLYASLFARRIGDTDYGIERFGRGLARRLSNLGVRFPSKIAVSYTNATNEYARLNRIKAEERETRIAQQKSFVFDKVIPQMFSYSLDEPIQKLDSLYREIMKTPDIIDNKTERLYLAYEHIVKSTNCASIDEWVRIYNNVIIQARNDFSKKYFLDEEMTKLKYVWGEEPSYWLKEMIGEMNVFTARELTIKEWADKIEKEVSEVLTIKEKLPRIIEYYKGKEKKIIDDYIDRGEWTKLKTYFETMDI